MGIVPTREEAYHLLNEYNKDEFHLHHGVIVEQVMKRVPKCVAGPWMN